MTIEKTKQNLKVCAIYCPPSYNIYEDEYKTIFNKRGGHFIIRRGFIVERTLKSTRLINPNGPEL